MSFLKWQMRKNKLKVLIFTDHSGHSAENSLYALSVALLNHPKVQIVDIASRGNAVNQNFFQAEDHADLYATGVSDKFSFDILSHPLSHNLKMIDPMDYDWIWLRLPPPLNPAFVTFLSKNYGNKFIFNNPESIITSGSKDFLMRFGDVCPPMKICRTAEDIIRFKERFPIVLKPFREYGGQGIVRIEGDKVWTGNQIFSLGQFINSYKGSNVHYLGVKFLKKVTEGDKRIIVVNGQILGASLRLPAAGSWLCNVAMGGKSIPAEISPEEQLIVDRINPELADSGIVMYGVDTLMDDDGKRKLSEINTTSIGGLPQIEKQKNKPVVKEAIELIWNYYEEHYLSTHE